MNTNPVHPHRRNLTPTLAIKAQRVCTPHLNPAEVQIFVATYEIWRIASQTWSNSFTRHVPFHTLISLHFSHPQQYSSQDCTDGSSSLTSSHIPTNPPVSGDQHSLGLLPASAYSKPEDMDPLSLPTEETSDSDGECFSLSETDLGTSRPMQGPIGEHTCRFYGKSSLLAFTNRAFNETGESPCPSRPHTYREEFWVTPDVSPSIW